MKALHLTAAVKTVSSGRIVGAVLALSAQFACSGADTTDIASPSVESGRDDVDGPRAFAEPYVVSSTVFGMDATIGYVGHVASLGSDALFDLAKAREFTGPTLIYGEERAGWYALGTMAT